MAIVAFYGDRSLMMHRAISQALFPGSPACFMAIVIYVISPL
jgi:hypothetical protein